MPIDIKADREFLEVLVREISRVEYLHEFEEDSKLKARYASDIIEKNARISTIKDNVLKVFDKEVIESKLNGILYDSYNVMKEEFRDDYFNCKNCLYTHNWPNGTQIALEEKVFRTVFCTVYPEVENAESGDARNCEDFLTSDESTDEYNNKLTYFNKKINELLNKEKERK